MFEVGKLSDETMDSFISELEKVGGVNSLPLSVGNCGGIFSQLIM